MKPRRNPNPSLHDRFFPITPPSPSPDRSVARMHPPVAVEPSKGLVAQPGTPTEPKFVLENEIPTDELNRFVLGCFEDLMAIGKGQRAKQVVERAISKRLPTFRALKEDLQASRLRQRTHHVWTKQFVDAVEPVLKCLEAPEEEQQKLSGLATQCVEKNLQMLDHIDHLNRLVSFLGRATSRHLVQVGTEIGLPREILEKLARLVGRVMAS